jgi:hypothetical protein
MGWYILILLAFAIVTAGFQNYLLAGIELAVTAVVFWLYMIGRRNRKKRLQEFILKHLDETSGVQGLKPPFPMLVLRLEDSIHAYVRKSLYVDKALEFLGEESIDPAESTALAREAYENLFAEPAGDYLAALVDSFQTV